MKRSLSQTLFIVLFALLAVRPALASTEISPESLSCPVTWEGPQVDWCPNGILINDTIGYSTQKNPRTACVGADLFITVWEDDRNGYSDIYAQMTNDKGVNLWGENGIAICLAGQNQSSPQAVPDGSGGAIVVWEDYRNGTSNVYAQRVNRDGKALWKPDGISVYESKAGQRAPVMTSDGFGGAIIAWFDYRSGKGEDIYAQRLDPKGNLEWSKNSIAVCVADGTQWYPEIISDGASGAIIAWTDFRSGKGSDIYAQHLDINGNIVWQPDGLPVCFAQDNQAYPKIASDGSGGAIIAWEDSRSENSDIYAQKVTFSGKPLWELNGILVYESGKNEERPAIAKTTDGGAIVCWISRQGDSSELHSQRLGPKGELLWGKTGNSVAKTTGTQDHYKMIDSNDGGAIIVWEDTREGPRNIYAQKIFENGVSLWGLDGMPICPVSADCDLPDLSETSNGTTMIVWQDGRMGDLDIYAQSISSDGGIRWEKEGKVINSSLGSVAQQNPRVAYCTEKSHIVVWEDGRFGSTNIYAQRIDDSGGLLWQAEGVAISNAGGAKDNEELISSDDGSVIVAWEDHRNKKFINIYAQKISKDGRSLWAASGVAASRSQSNKGGLKLVSDGAGGAIIVWEEIRGATLTDVYCQRINSGGTALWAENGVAICNSQSDQTGPCIATDGAGGAMIAWVDSRSGLFNKDIYAQRITSAGIAAWKANGEEVCTAPDDQKSPAITEDDKGGAIITWTDKGGGGYDIYAQIMDAQGKPALVADGVPVCKAPGTQKDPVISGDGAGGAIIAWVDFRNANWDIFAQRLNAKGEILWGEAGLPVCKAPLTQFAPQILTGSWGAIITWEDYRNAKNYNIYVQKLTPSGDFIWQQDGSPLCAGPEGERNPRIAANGQGGAMIAWEDYRAGGFGVYAQKIKVLRIQ
jgi:hypothetical protein